MSDIISPEPREGDLIVVTDKSDLAHGLHGVVVHVFDDGLHVSLIEGYEPESDDDDGLVLYQPEQVSQVFPVKVQLSLFGASGRREVLVYNEDRTIEVDSMSPAYSGLGSPESTQRLVHLSGGKASFFVLAHVDPETKQLQISSNPIEDQGW